MGGDTAKGLRFWVEGSRVSGVKLFLLFLWGMGVGVSWGAGKWGMVDTNGTWRLPEKYDEVGEYCMKCRKKSEVGSVEKVSAETKKGVKYFKTGACVVCGTKTFKTISKKNFEEA